MPLARIARRALAACIAAAFVSPLAARTATPVRSPAAAPAVPVTVKNFRRAESDMYFSRSVKNGAFGKFHHERAPMPIEKQDVIRSNRDTVYSYVILDLDAGPATITLPDTGKRFQSLPIIDEDAYSPAAVYAPGTFTFSKDKVGTRYIMAAVRTLANATDPADLEAANALLGKFAARVEAAQSSVQRRGVAIVLLGPVLWSRMQVVDGAVSLKVHVAGPEPGDVVAVIDVAVIEGIADGQIDVAGAVEAGVLRLYGPSADVSATYDWLALATHD